MREEKNFKSIWKKWKKKQSNDFGYVVVDCKQLIVRLSWLTQAIRGRWLTNHRNEIAKLLIS